MTALLVLYAHSRAVLPTTFPVSINVLQPRTNQNYQNNQSGTVSDIVPGEGQQFNWMPPVSSSESQKNERRFSRKTLAFKPTDNILWNAFVRQQCTHTYTHTTVQLVNGRCVDAYGASRSTLRLIIIVCGSKSFHFDTRRPQTDLRRANPAIKT